MVNKIKNSSAHWSFWVLLLLFIIFALARCGLFFGSTKVENKDNHYEVYRLDREAGWKTTSKSESDYAYEHEPSGTIVSLNSVCGEDRGKPLSEVQKHLFLGLKMTSTLEQNEIQMDGVPAMDGVVDIEAFDGSEVEDEEKTPSKARVRAVVLRKGICVYDFMYVSPKKSFDKQMASFERFLKGFHADK